jgi:hypothetical protein
MPGKPGAKRRAATAREPPKVSAATSAPPSPASKSPNPVTPTPADRTPATMTGSNSADTRCWNANAAPHVSRHQTQLTRQSHPADTRLTRGRHAIMSPFDAPKAAARLMTRSNTRVFHPSDLKTEGGKKMPTIEKCACHACQSPSPHEDRMEMNAFHRVPPRLSWPPHLHTDDVVWLPSEGRWVGRTSPHLSKKARDDAANHRRFTQHDRPQPEPPKPTFDDLF